MNWPWVSRELLTTAIRAREHAHFEIAELRGELRAAQERYDKLVAELIKMQRDGFSLPQPLTPMEPVLPTDPDVAAAIEEMMNPTGEVGRKVSRWAQQQLRQGKDPKTVALAIRNGEG